jgi:hypothetical protein
VPIDRADPDLDVSLRLDDFAPRAARYHVTRVGRPSPDLRDAVALLTSELVSRAVEHARSTSGASVQLRAWMRSDLVRVELRAPRQLLDLPRATNGTEYDLAILDQVADRWSIDASEPSACMWFEIDRLVHGAGDDEPPDSDPLLPGASVDGRPHSQ